MKKNPFFLAAATVALASCSNEEMIELNKGNAIDFRAAMSVATRGAETTTENIGQFYVTAIDGDNIYFTDELYTPEDPGNSTIFVSSPESEYYWPGARTLNFYAYSYFAGTDSKGKLNKIDFTKLGEIEITKAGQTIKGFSPAENVAHQIDFVSAVATESKASAPNGVPLNFRHNLIQAEVKAKTTNKTYTFEIAGIKFGNIVSKGDFKFVGENKWTLGTETTDYVIEYAKAFALNPEAPAPEDLSDLDNVQHMMLLPQTTEACDASKGKGYTDKGKGAYIAVKLKITTNKTKAQVYPYAENTNAYEWAYVPVKMEWKAGNRYVYTLDFSHGAGYDENGDPILGEPIKFNTTVSDWVDANPMPDDPDMDVPDVKDKTN